MGVPVIASDVWEGMKWLWAWSWSRGHDRIAGKSKAREEICNPELKTIQFNKVQGLVNSKWQLTLNECLLLLKELFYKPIHCATLKYYNFSTGGGRLLISNFPLAVWWNLNILYNLQ